MSQERVRDREKESRGRERERDREKESRGRERETDRENESREGEREKEGLTSDIPAHSLIIFLGD